MLEKKLRTFRGPTDGEEYCTFSRHTFFDVKTYGWGW